MSKAEILRKYRAMPYRRRVEKVTDEKEGTYFICSYPELPGLAADGETRAEAIRNAQEAFDDYVLARAHWGDPLPEPVGAKRLVRALELANQAVKVAVRVEFEVEEPEVSFAKKGIPRKTLKAIRECEGRATRSGAGSEITPEAVAATG